MSIKLISAVWENAPVDGQRLLVLLALADYANDDGYCWPSVPNLAAKARASDRWVQLTLRDLESNGILELVSNGGGRHKPNLYRLNLPEIETVKRVNSATERVNPSSPDPSLEPSIRDRFRKFFRSST